jgi:hypothetical protein
MNTRVLKLGAIEHWQMTPHESLDQAVVLLFDHPPEAMLLEPDLDPIERSREYLEERERVWQEKKNAYGDRLWNGRVCTVRSISVKDRAVVLRLSACEYKDILFKKQLGWMELQRRFPGEPVDIHAFTAALPITDDGQAVFGVVGRGTVQSEGLLDLIGGTLNIDEHPISSFDDIKQTTAREFEEEAGAHIPIAQWEPLSINFHGSCCFFLLLSRIARERVVARFRRNEELAALVSCSYDQMSELGENITEDLAFMLSYGSELKNLFERS